MRYDIYGDVMKIIMIPDSFKGSISSKDAALTMKRAALDWNPFDEVLAIPIADGGEGTVECFLEITKGKKMEIDTFDLYMNPITVVVCEFDGTYVIEAASVVGLTLSKIKEPLKASTYGLGILINKLLAFKPKRIIVGLGGSGTNDGGIGMAIALGTKFYDSDGKIMLPSINTLNDINSIDNQEVYNKIKDIEIIGLCDVNNPFCGKIGATYVYGPQKGIKENELEEVDLKLYHLAKQIKNNLSIDILEKKGSGAAGGLGGAILAFLNGNLQSGIDLILDLVNFNELLKDTDYVITGEGKFDFQSLNGKVIQGIAKRCKLANVGVIVLCGKYEPIDQPLTEYNIKDVICINPPNIDYEMAIKHVRSYLLDATNTAMNYIYSWKYK